ncbi:hypothetical protein BJY04DRAFT_219775 [Aspergillus karnatakaensis]|uniref:uncharacterized protein n=1 Tax=Aspergillus karnatakaensis TaxID=1810916 RepID=UPI003CCDC60C
MGAPDDRSAVLIIAAGVLMPVACITVLLRCYVRASVTNAFGWDDTLMVLATIVYIGFSLCLILASAKYGWGRRIADKAVSQRVTGMKYYFASNLAYDFSSFLWRLSICLLLLRITIKPVHVRTVQVVMLLGIVATIVYTVSSLSLCRPLAYYWRQAAFDPATKGACQATAATVCMYFYSIAVAICDLTLGFLPVCMVWNLQMPKVTKALVGIILSLGGVASAGTIVRIVYVSAAHDGDFLYNSVYMVLWAFIEVGVGITAGSLATLGPLLRPCMAPRVERVQSDDENPCAGPSPRAPQRDRRRSIHNLSLPLASIPTQFRPDKVAEIVTKVQSLPTTNSDDSRSRLAFEEERDSAGASNAGYGIFRRCEVSQTSDVESAHEQRCS